jgi:molybdopterin/thiamine biosynthesis adenylyltransferase
VGQLNLVDGDRFEDHNLNRQLLCTQHRIGTSKARAAAERVCAINSSLAVEAYEEFLDSKNAPRLIRDSDAVVDCLDNIESRFVLEAAAKAANIPMVSAAVAGLSGQVTTIFPQDEGLELIYGPIDRLTSPKGAETVLGCLPQAVGLIAAAESGEVIKVLLGQDKQLLRNQMLWVDMSANTYETLKLG